MNICTCVAKLGKLCDNCQKEADEFYAAFAKETVEKIKDEFLIECNAEERLIASYFEFDR